jgi:hypothetical protein
MVVDLPVMADLVELRLGRAFETSDQFIADLVCKIDLLHGNLLRIARGRKFRRSPTLRSN